MRNVLRFLENLMFPPRCVACRAFLQKDILDSCESPLCQRCRVEWEREKGEDCPDCGMEMNSCECCPSRLKKGGITYAVKLVNYVSTRETAGRRSILSMKKRANHRAVDFFAEQLSYPVKRYMDEHGLAAEQVAFCYVPRGRRNVSKYGFDQSRLLCRSLAVACGAKDYPLFVRVSSKSKEQKKLSAEARKRNSQNQYAVRKRISEKLPRDVKCLFLLDDIVTTGESMLGCVKALKGRYGGEIVAVSLARTPKKRTY